MKNAESLMSESTKQSLIRISSDSTKMTQSVKVFIQVQNRTCSISIPLQSKTIQSLIIESLKHFNLLFCLGLSDDHQDYAVYAARKNGNKCRDYPSFANTQNILYTNSKFYYLAKKSKQQRIVAYPLTQINMNIKKQEKRAKKNAACFCIFL